MKIQEYRINFTHEKCKKMEEQGEGEEIDNNPNESKLKPARNWTLIGNGVTADRNCLYYTYYRCVRIDAGNPRYVIERSEL
jgi:hypothetical protein